MKWVSCHLPFLMAEKNGHCRASRRNPCDTETKAKRMKNNWPPPNGRLTHLATGEQVAPKKKKQQGPESYYFYFVFFSFNKMNACCSRADVFLGWKTGRRTYKRTAFTCSQHRSAFASLDKETTMKIAVVSLLDPLVGQIFKLQFRWFEFHSSLSNSH